MRNKSAFLATTAVALFLGAGQAQSGDLYVSVLGGLNWQPDNSGSVNFITCCPQDATASFSSDVDTGFVLGGAIGTHLDKWAQGLRVELEVSYRRNDIGGEHHLFMTGSEGFADGPISGNSSNFAILANVWYDIDMGWKVVPYIGGGAGWAKSRVDAVAAITTSDLFTPTSTWDNTEQENNGFAYQLGAGFNYPVAPGIDLGLGYRFFRGPSFDPLFVGKNELAVPFDNNNHVVAANLTININ